MAEATTPEDGFSVTVFIDHVWRSGLKNRLGGRVEIPFAVCALDKDGDFTIGQKIVTPNLYLDSLVSQLLRTYTKVRVFVDQTKPFYMDTGDEEETILHPLFTPKVLNNDKLVLEWITHWKRAPSGDEVVIGNDQWTIRVPLSTDASAEHTAQVFHEHVTLSTLGVKAAVKAT